MIPSIPAWRGRCAQIFLLVVVCTVLLIGIGLLTLLAGTPSLSLSDLWGIFTGGGTSLARVVVIPLRLPRLVLAILAGAMLALSGGMLQDALQNALAGPELLGVSAGAAVVVAAITILHLAVIFSAVLWLSQGPGQLAQPGVLLPFVALLGGLAGGGLVYLFSWRGKNASGRLVLIRHTD